MKNKTLGKMYVTPADLYHIRFALMLNIDLFNDKQRESKSALEKLKKNASFALTDAELCAVALSLHRLHDLAQNHDYTGGQKPSPAYSEATMRRLLLMYDKELAAIGAKIVCKEVSTLNTKISSGAVDQLAGAIERGHLWATPQETAEWMKTESGQRISKLIEEQRKRNMQA